MTETQTTWPLITDNVFLESRLGEEDLLIVDLSKKETYDKYHIPGAIHLEYPKLIRVQKPVMGLLPSDAELSALFSQIGLTPSTQVVAYDDEGGGKASRLLWTLDVIGHTRFALLNGGLMAWANNGHPLTEEVPEAHTSAYSVQDLDDKVIADKAYILARLEDDNTVIVDARTPEEYSGEKKFSERGGHIPGAINLDWVLAMDKNNDLRLLPEGELRAMFEDQDITPDKEVIVYCQSHHRSAFTYIVLKSLGYEQVRGYPGAWSDWGNDPDTPVETGAPTAIKQAE